MPVGATTCVLALWMARAWAGRGLLVLAVLLAMMPVAHAAKADCDGPFAVGRRTLALADGREIAVWYPVAAPPTPAPREDAPIASCPTRWPLLLFSHGVAGCNEQVLYLTEEIARHGYVVAAPNHRDAICGVVTRRKYPDAPDSTRPAFLDPAAWTAAAWRERMEDLRQTVQVVTADDRLGRAIDRQRLGLMGHSLGGYTVLGAAGGWNGWEIPGVRAVLALAPFVQPLLAHRRLRALQVPVMYQVAAWDFGITPGVVGEGGAFAASPAPKYLVELGAAGHMLWTNLPCNAYATTTGCLAAVADARLVDAYALAFFDRHLKGRPAPLLDGKGAGLREYRARR